ncbi:MAG: hypothetical protein ACI8RD_014738, partial [Bacillariaceae sp.]
WKIVQGTTITEHRSSRRGDDVYVVLLWLFCCFLIHIHIVPGQKVFSTIIAVLKTRLLTADT